MRAILDTHTFLWWNMNDPRLSPAARKLTADEGNEIFLRAASAWETAIQCARGRQVLPAALPVYVADRMASQHFLPPPVQVSHVLHVFTLPEIHADRFDRLLIAQSQLEDLPIMTADLLTG
jgi:PIN domain nuclease of toxin-antitoxin system